MEKRSKANLDIRILIVENDYFYYQVADQMGISGSKFSELLRYELDEEVKEKIEIAIQQLNEKTHPF